MVAIVDFAFLPGAVGRVQGIFDEGVSFGGEAARTLHHLVDEDVVAVLNVQLAFCNGNGVTLFS